MHSKIAFQEAADGEKKIQQEIEKGHCDQGGDEMFPLRRVACKERFGVRERYELVRHLFRQIIHLLDLILSPHDTYEDLFYQHIDKENADG